MFIIDWVLDKFGYVNKASIVFSINKPITKKPAKKTVKKTVGKRRLG